MEGGAFQSESFARASQDYVFVFLHQTREDSRDSYKLVTEEYLEEEFLHPAYIFLRPDGTEEDPEYRSHHMALSGGQMLKILKKIQKDWGRGLSIPEYEKAKAETERGEKEMRERRWADAESTFKPLSRLKARCGVKDRAGAALRFLDTLKDLSESFARIEGVPEGAAERVSAALAAGDLPEAYRQSSGSSEILAAFREELVGALRSTIRLLPIRLDKVRLSTGTYHYLRAECQTDLPPFDGLGLQISYLTDKGRTLEGYGIFDEVEPHGHHRAAASLSSRQLRFDELVNVRAQIWLGDLLLHESLHAKAPADFPADDSHVLVGPDLLGEGECLGVNLHSTLRSYRLGRYAPPAGR